MQSFKSFYCVGLLLLAACGSSPTESGAPGSRPSSSSVSLDGCKLDRPIEIGTNDLTTAVPKILVDAVFDQPIKTASLRAHDSLQVRLFRISDTNYIGGSVDAVVGGESTHSGVGFANVYVGSFNFTGGKTSVNSQSLYTTRNTYEWGSGTTTRTEITEIKISLEGTRITGIQFIIPVLVHSSSSYRFEGENQTLCLKSARLQ